MFVSLSGVCLCGILGVEMSPPLAAQLGVWAEAEGWSRMPQRRRPTPKPTSMEPNPRSEGRLNNQISELTAGTRSATTENNFKACYAI